MLIIITFHQCCIGNAFFTPGTFTHFISFDHKNKSMIKAGRVFIMCMCMGVCLYLSTHTCMCVCVHVVCASVCNCVHFWVALYERVTVCVCVPTLTQVTVYVVTVVAVGCACSACVPTRVGPRQCAARVRSDRR